MSMTREEAICTLERLQHTESKWPGTEDTLEALDLAITALRTPTLTPPNEPLTLEQLRQMDGEPVWDENGKCYLVDTTYRFCSCSDIEIAIEDKNGDVKRYPQRRALYRRPPEEE